MTEKMYEGKPIFEAANKEELEKAVASYEGEVESPYVVRLPEKIRKVEERAFFGDKTIGVVFLPCEVEEIGRGAFAFCTRLTRIVVPESLKVIRKAAFLNCKSLADIYIPASVKVIEDRAFEDCARFLSISIPASVEEIGSTVFNGCVELSIIKVNKANAKYSSSSDNCNAIIDTTTNTLLYGCKNTHIPDGVKIIGNGAFRNIASLEYINIPKSVTDIEKAAFEGCTGLEWINIYNSVSRIGFEAFKGCCTLTKLIIPDSVKKIDEDAFSGCSGLEEVLINNSKLLKIAGLGTGVKITKSKVKPGDEVSPLDLVTNEASDIWIREFNERCPSDDFQKKYSEWVEDNLIVFG